MDAPLFVERGDGFGPGDLAAARAHGAEAGVRIDGADDVLDEIAAVVHLADDAVGVEAVVGGDRCTGPAVGTGAQR